MARRRRRRTPLDKLWSCCRKKKAWFACAALAVAALLLLPLLPGEGAGAPDVGRAAGSLLERAAEAWDELTGGGREPAREVGEFELHLIDVGQGLSVLVRAPGGMDALIDAGVSDAGDDVIDYLEAQGIDDIDLLVATHPHADHIGGMKAVVGHFRVGRVMMSDIPERLIPATKTYTGLLGAIRDKGLRITLARAGDDLVFGGARLSFEGPVHPGDAEDLNDVSVVCRFTYGDCAFLITGDAEEAEERDMLARRRPLGADVLIAGHHGSSTSTSQAFLKKVRPLYAGISCGAGNSYGHPHAVALARLEEAGCAVLRTDVEGSVVFLCDGERIHVSLPDGAAA